jgi:hypothetical protein
MARLSTGWNTSPTNSTTDGDRRKAEYEMQATALYGARDVRLEDRAEPIIIEPTDAIVSLRRRA